MNKLIVYGAYGYSARLIIENLKKKNIEPVLAGRDEYKLRKAANDFDCDYMAFGLEGKNNLTEKIKDFHTVLNCAGPYKFTADKFIEACLATQTNYIDITGEIPAIEFAWKNNQPAIENNITILPAVGFDVIPTDCIAKKLKQSMNDAISLKLGFEGINTKISRGTYLTTLEMINEDGKIRKDGKIISIPLADLTYEIKNDKIDFEGVAIPWGDVSSAYYSTGIPNIEVYLGLSKSLYIARRLLAAGKNLIGLNSVKDFLMKQLSKRTDGPTDYERQKSSMIVWGEVSNNKGEKLFEAYRFIDGYEITGRGAAEAVESVLNDKVNKGTQTPSLVFGYEFMNQFVIEKIVEMKIS